MTQTKRTNPGHAASRRTMRAKTDKRWAEAFAGESLSTKMLCERLGYSYMGCLASLYRLEKRGVVARKGVAASGGNRPTVLWQWVGG